MIRGALLKAVYDVLGSHRYFAVEDFSVFEYLNNGKQPCLSVTYRHEEGRFFNFHIPQGMGTIEGTQHYIFTCTVNPGRESASEELRAIERSGMLDELKQWMGRLYEDCLSAPAVRQFAEHAAEIEAIRERLEQLPDEPIGREEAREFRDALARLQAELVEQLQAESADKEALKRSVAELSRDVEFLRQSLESMSRRTWAEVLWVRMRKWTQKFNLKQLAAGTRAVKQLLPPEVAAGLDTVAATMEVLASAEGEATPPTGNGAGQGH